MPNTKENGWFLHQKQLITDRNEIYNKLLDVDKLLYTNHDEIKKIIKNYLDDYLKINKKIILSFDESLKIFVEFVNKNTRIPQKKENGWFSYQRHQIENDNEIYNKLLDVDKLLYTNHNEIKKIIKDNLDDYLKRNKNLSFDESLKIFVEFINKNTRIPQKKENKWFSVQKQLITNKNEIYNKLLDVDKLLYSNHNELKKLLKII